MSKFFFKYISVSLKFSTSLARPFVLRRNYVFDNSKRKNNPNLRRSLIFSSTYVTKRSVVSSKLKRYVPHAVSAQTKEPGKEKTHTK